MTDHDLDLLRAADPLPRAHELRVDTAALLDGILASDRRDPTSVTQGDGERVSAGEGRWWRRTMPRVALVGAAAVAVLVAVAVLPGTGGDHGGAAIDSAYGAEAIRFAENSPLVLLHADGWRVEYADEQSAREGELHFRTGPTPPPGSGDVIEGVTPTPVPADTTQAQLNWRGGSLEQWADDRGHDAVVRTTAPALGTTARVFQYPGGTPGHRDITAVLRYDGRVLEFRAGARDIAAFKALLAELTRVPTEAWLDAMPASAVKQRDRGTAIAGMLEGIPLPDGFDAAAITGEDLTKDRYQLGVAVAGTVACRWMQQWQTGRDRGDRKAVAAAIAAMATAKDWPILKEMTKTGDYPEVLIGFAAHMRSGRWFGRPLAGDVNSGLGCPDLGAPVGDGKGPGGMEP